MQPFQFQSRIWLARPIAEVFQFFSDAKNLQQITPPLLDFRVTAMSTERIESGTRIDYKLKIRGFPVRWQSEITEWEPPHRFVDRQLRGPYALWLHEHRFRAQDGGTQCEDVVRYLPPGGVLLAPAINRIFVARDVERIFAYRRQRLQEIFPSSRGLDKP